jgi:hypothetical protein
MSWVIKASRVNELDVYRTTQEFKVVTSEDERGVTMTTAVIPAGTLVQIQALDMTENGVEIADIEWKDGDGIKAGTVSTKALVANSEHVPAGTVREESKQWPWTTKVPSNRPRKRKVMKKPDDRPQATPWVTAALSHHAVHKTNIISSLDAAREDLFNTSNGPLHLAAFRIEAAVGDQSLYEKYVERVRALIGKVVEATSEANRLKEEIQNDKEIK